MALAYFGADDQVLSPAELRGLNGRQMTFHNNVRRVFLERFADVFATEPPRPVVTFRSAGEPDTSIPEVQATRLAFQDTRKCWACSMAYELTGDAKFLAAVEGYLTAWVAVNVPDPEVINNLNYVPMCHAIAKRRADLSAPLLFDLDQWMIDIADTTRQGITDRRGLDSGGVGFDGADNHITAAWAVILAAHNARADAAAITAELPWIDDHIAKNIPFGNPANVLPPAFSILSVDQAARVVDVSGDVTGEIAIGDRCWIWGAPDWRNNRMHEIEAVNVAGGVSTLQLATSDLVTAGAGGLLYGPWSSDVQNPGDPDPISTGAHELPRPPQHAGESYDYMRRDALNYQAYNGEMWAEIALLTGSRYQTQLEYYWSFFRERILDTRIHYEFESTSSAFDRARFAASNSLYLQPQSDYDLARASRVIWGYIAWQRSISPSYDFAPSGFELKLANWTKRSRRWPSNVTFMMRALFPGLA